MEPPGTVTGFCVTLPSDVISAVVSVDCEMSVTKVAFELEAELGETCEDKSVELAEESTALKLATREVGLDVMKTGVDGLVVPLLVTEVLEPLLGKGAVAEIEETLVSVSVKIPVDLVFVSSLEIIEDTVPLPLDQVDVPFVG
jgi:hypothetical protein